MNNDEGLSLTALAKVLGRAKSGLHKLAKNGQLPRLSNGRFDLAQVQKALEENVEPSRARGVHLKRGERSPEARGEQVNGKVNTGSVETGEDASAAVTLIKRVLEEEGVPAGKVDFSAARTAELILKSRERWMRLQIEQGKLCDVQTVHREVFKMARVDRDAWMNWPSRVAPLLASETGADQVKLTVLMERYVRDHLTESANALRLNTPNEEAIIAAAGVQ